MKCQTNLCWDGWVGGWVVGGTEILLCTMTAPPPGICLLIILIWIQTVRMWVCEALMRRRLIGLHGLFCHLYFSVHRGYLRNYNCCWVGCVLMFFNQIEFCFSVNDDDDDDERHISRSVSLCINVFFFRWWKESGQQQPWRFSYF